MSWPDRTGQSQRVDSLTPIKTLFGTKDGMISAIDRIVGPCPERYKRRMTFSNQLKISNGALRYIETHSGAAHMPDGFFVF